MLSLSSGDDCDRGLPCLHGALQLRHPHLPLRHRRYVTVACRASFHRLSWCQVVGLPLGSSSVVLVSGCWSPTWVFICCLGVRLLVSHLGLRLLSWCQVVGLSLGSSSVCVFVHICRSLSVCVSLVCLFVQRCRSLSVCVFVQRYVPKCRS